MTHQEMLLAGVELGGPPYGVLYGARMTQRTYFEHLLSLPREDLELIASFEMGDQIHDLAHNYNKRSER